MMIYESVTVSVVNASCDYCFALANQCQVSALGLGPTPYRHSLNFDKFMNAMVWYQQAHTQGFGG